MEHRHDRQRDVRLAQAWPVRLVGQQRVQHDRAVRVDDALGPACRPARVTHSSRRILVHLGPLELGIAGGKQLLVVQGAIALRLRVRHQHLVLDPLEARHRVGQRRVEEHHAILGVPHDVVKVVLEQPDVQRVQHGAHRRHGQVELEVASRVPSERRHAVAAPDPQLAQRARQAVGPLHDLGVARALHAVGGEAHDLALSEQLPRPLGDPAHEQRGALHQAVHLATARTLASAAAPGALRACRCTRRSARGGAACR